MDETHWTEQPTAFEKRWARMRNVGMQTGSFGPDPFIASLWYHQGAADMAREFAAGQGAVLAKLDAIETAIKNVELAADDS